MAKPKPWHGLHDEHAVLPEAGSLQQLLEFCEQLEKVESWRRNRWKTDHPRDQSEIDEVIDRRLKPIRIVSEIIRGQLKHGSIDEQKGAYMLILAGMQIQKRATIWQEHMSLTAAEQSDRGRRLAKVNASNAFKIDREQLLDRCKKAYRMYQCNQAELREHVSNGLCNAIGAERVKQLMRVHKITKADYATER